MGGGLDDFEIAGVVADQERDRIALGNADLIQGGRGTGALVEQQVARYPMRSDHDSFVGHRSYSRHIFASARTDGSKALSIFSNSPSLSAIGTENDNESMWP